MIIMDFINSRIIFFAIFKYVLNFLGNYTKTDQLIDMFICYFAGNIHERTKPIKRWRKGIITSEETKFYLKFTSIP